MPNKKSEFGGSSVEKVHPQSPQPEKGDEHSTEDEVEQGLVVEDDVCSSCQ